jgi:predicted 2-oxoglutarate/Fe(II)-dependent dioxygenase YbiX
MGKKIAYKEEPAHIALVKKLKKLRRTNKAKFREENEKAFYDFHGSCSKTAKHDGVLKSILKDLSFTKLKSEPEKLALEIEKLEPKLVDEEKEAQN